MKLPAFYLVVLQFVCHVLAAQEAPEIFPRIAVSSVYVEAGMFGEKVPPATLSDFVKLAPGSVLLKNDLSGFSTYSDYTSAIYPLFGIMAGIRFSNRERTAYRQNPVLRVGIQFSTGMIFDKNYIRHNTTTFDTITTSSGQIAYMDSVGNETYSMEYHADRMKLEASLIYSTNPASRWSLFAGFGILGGLSFNAFTRVEYDDASWIELRYSGSSGYSNSQYYSGARSVSRSESLSNKTNLYFSPFIPMGINLRLGKNREFWKRISVYYEARPGIHFTSIPELRTIITPSVHSLAGIKVAW